MKAMRLEALITIVKLAMVRLYRVIVIHLVLRAAVVSMDSVNVNVTSRVPSVIDAVTQPLDCHRAIQMVVASVSAVV